MKAARVWAPGEFEALQVAPAVSADPARETMNKPWGQSMNGRGFICGSDGHRLHAVHAEPEAWLAYKRDNAPPAEHVIPWDAQQLGEISPEEAWDHFPAKWDVALTISRDYRPSLFAAVTKGSGKNEKRVRVLNEVSVDWPIKLARADFSVCVHLAYLRDACEFIGTGTVYVWGGRKKNPEIAPLAFTATCDPLRDQKRIAVVMPRRL